MPFLVALSALVGLGSPTLAAIPPDVALDATVVVVVSKPGDGSAAGAPVAGATVAIRATRDGEVIQELSGTTGSDGRAALSGVARASGGSPVTITITASREQQTVDASGCTTAASWSGQATVPVSATAVEVAIVATAASSIQCPPPGNIGGSVLAATGRPRTTPPPTDAIGGSGGDRPRSGLVLAVAGALLLAGAATLGSTRRRRQTVRRSTR